ncbi:unnamed protein product [Camellia sinensis]
MIEILHRNSPATALFLRSISESPIISLDQSQLYRRRTRPQRKKKMTEATIRNKPGMASVKDMPIVQDGPPPGGFAPVRFARRIPNKGPSAVAIFLTTFGVFSWGMYQVGKGNKIRRCVGKRFKKKSMALLMIRLNLDQFLDFVYDLVCKVHMVLLGPLWLEFRFNAMVKSWPNNLEVMGSSLRAATLCTMPKVRWREWNYDGLLEFSRKLLFCFISFVTLLRLYETSSKGGESISVRELKEEKYAARKAILPMLQAEEDERFVKEWKKYLEEEARIMKDVPGWKVGESVYNSGRWMPPATGELRPDV